MIEKVSGSVALNWSPTPNFPIAPARLASRSCFFSDSSPPPQPVSARVVAPAAAASTWRLESWFMKDSFSWGAGAALPLHGAEHHAGHEVALDERVDEHDWQDGQHDRHRLDVGVD